MHISTHDARVPKNRGRRTLVTCHVVFAYFSRTKNNHPATIHTNSDTNSDFLSVKVFGIEGERERKREMYVIERISTHVHQYAHKTQWIPTPTNRGRPPNVYPEFERVRSTLVHSSTRHEFAVAHIDKQPSSSMVFSSFCFSVVYSVLFLLRRRFCRGSLFVAFIPIEYHIVCQPETSVHQSARRDGRERQD